MTFSLLDENCPICDFKNRERLNNDIPLVRCLNCNYIQKDPGLYLSISAEKKHYDHHENDPKDERYRNFLSQLSDRLLPYLAWGQCGLDYGCGSGPTLSGIFQEQGFSVENWDPYYHNNSDLLKATYDFVTSTEVVEHFNNPKQSWEKMCKLVKSGGLLGIMTSFWDDKTDLSTWYYFCEPTHISFYHKKTLEVIANKFGFKILENTNKITILEKHS